MKFGSIPVESALGSIAAHTLRLPKSTIKKGTILGRDEIAALHAAGISEITAATAAPGDLLEDEAAARLAAAVAGRHLSGRGAKTGRVNLYSDAAGVALIDRGLVDRLNRLDPALTLATASPYAPVAVGEMVATIKIIPYAAPAAAVEAAEALCRTAKPIAVAPYALRRVAVVATSAPSLRTSVMDKTRRVLDERLAPTGAAVTDEIRVPHETGAVTDAIGRMVGGAEMLVLFGASAVTDGGDVIPAAIRAAGGEVLQVGIPVDPGNLLVLGHIGAMPVIGAPGCARSPRENGFDWVLQRLLAKVPVTASDLTGLGVGGLLKEIASRKEPRERADVD
ncbi:MAG: molybdopterin-binding protein [Bauldia sp.]